MKKYLLYFVMIITLFITFKINVFAYENYNTTYTINYTDYSTGLNTNLPYDSKTYKLLFDEILSVNSEYYNSIILARPSTSEGIYSFLVYLIPKSDTTFNVSLMGYNVSSSSWNLIMRHNTGYKVYGYTYTQNQQAYSSFYNNLMNCLETNSCSSYGSSSNSDTLSQLFSGQLNNSNNYTIDFSYAGDSFYYFIYGSQVPIKMVNSQTGNNYFYKNLNVNGITYNKNDYFPTYKDLINDVDDSNAFNKQSDNQLQTIYSRVSTDNINNYKMIFEFIPYSTTPQEYLENMGWGFNILVSGRVNHNNDYYTYEDLYCDFDDIQYEYIDNKLKFTFSGIVCDSSVNLSNYDYIYFTLVENYNNWNINKNKDLIGIVLNANYGDFIYRPYAQSIYEYLEDLPSYFSFMLSTAQDSDKYGKDVSLYSSNNSTFYSAYSMTNLTQYLNYTGRITKDENIVNYSPSLTYLYLNNQFRNTQDYAYMIYDNDGVDSTDIHLFLSSEVIVSFNNNGNYYMYNPNTHTIDNRNITIERQIDSNSDNTYDISYIINQINYYIDGLRDKIFDFSVLIQNFYNGLPNYVGGFIYILFCLICLKQVIKLVKNDNGKE